MVPSGAIEVIDPSQTHRSAPLDLSCPKLCLYPRSLETIPLRWLLKTSVTGKLPSIPTVSDAGMVGPYQSVKGCVRCHRDVVYHYQWITLSSIRMNELSSIRVLGRGENKTS